MTADPPSLAFTGTDWNTEQTVTVSAAQDDDDQDETATVKHTVSGYGSVTTAADVAVSVEDDAPETVTVSFEQAAYTMAEGGTKVIKVVLDADPERAVTVPLTHTGEGGASNSDYRRRAGQRRLQQRGHGEDIHHHRHTGHGGRRRRVHQARLREPAARRDGRESPQRPR